MCLLCVTAAVRKKILILFIVLSYYGFGIAPMDISLPWEVLGKILVDFLYLLIKQ